MAHIKRSVSIVSLPFHKEASILPPLPFGLLLEYLKEDTVSKDGLWLQKNLSETHVYLKVNSKHLPTSLERHLWLFSDKDIFEETSLLLLAILPTLCRTRGN